MRPTHTEAERVDPLLSVRDLKTYFVADEGTTRAVDGATFDVWPGQTLGIVGESGCGKSVTARSILRIVEAPGRTIGGHAVLRHAGEAVDLIALKPNSRRMRSIRGRVIAYVFQEPMASFSPVHTIGNQIVEVIQHHLRLGGRAARERGIDLLQHVGIPRAAERMDEYAFQLSGGLRQRAMIAMALACDPALLIADEPTTALDVTTQAQILDLLRDLQRQNGMAIMLITHNLGVVAEMANDVAVMYLGRVVESGPVERIFDHPQHPYTRALLESIPSITDRPRTYLPTIAGTLPHPFDRPSGCAFHPRCPSFMAGVCDQDSPDVISLGDAQTVSCFLYDGQLRATADRPAPLNTSHDGRAVVTSRALEPDRSPSAPPLLDVRQLSKSYPIERGWLRSVVGQVRAVERVSFQLYASETLALVGESGCGKTTTARCILRAVDPTGGEVLFHSAAGAVVDVARVSRTQLRPLRREMQMIFQDPFSSLNPRMTLLDIVAEPLLVNGIGSRTERIDRVSELLALVGLRPEYMRRYPHAFSGGQRQRIGIARALALEPRLVVADEAVSALDVSVQAQILNLLLELQQRLGLTYLFVAHDLSVVKHISDRVAVMYVGQLVELAETQALFERPLHPYTSALLGSIPIPDPRARGRPAPLTGEVANPAAPPSGCAFHPRCPFAVEECRTTPPAWEEIEPGRMVRCHRARELSLAGASHEPPTTINGRVSQS